MQARPGFCEVTEVSSCTVGEAKGAWQTSSLTKCISKCVDCSRCAFLSFSRELSDCSWFAACNLSRLESSSATHATLQVRRGSTVLERFAGGKKGADSTKALVAAVQEGLRRPRASCLARQLGVRGTEGFASHLVLFLNAAAYCERAGCTPVPLWASRHGSCYALADQSNAWSAYFEPVCPTRPPPLMGSTSTPQVEQDLEPMGVLTDGQYTADVEVPPDGLFLYYCTPLLVTLLLYAPPSPRGGLCDWSVFAAAADGDYRRKPQDTFDQAWYAAMRKRGSQLVRRYVVPLPSITADAARVWATLWPPSAGNGPVLGLQLRGTDIATMPAAFVVRRRVDLARVLPLVQSYLRAKPNARIFLATDDAGLLREILAWPKAVTARLAHRFHRGVGQGRSFRVGCSDRSVAKQQGLDVLRDILLLAKCNFLVHSASGVAEIVHYFQPNLHRHSVTLGYRFGYEHSWLWRAGNATHSAGAAVSASPADFAAAPTSNESQGSSTQRMLSRANFTAAHPAASAVFVPTAIAVGAAAAAPTMVKWRGDSTLWGTQGFCDVTDRREGRQCAEGDTKGSFWAPDLASCFAACMACKQCYYVSHNHADADCSWFRRCAALRKLGTDTTPGYSGSHFTWQLRDRSGTLFRRVQPTAAHIAADGGCAPQLQLPLQPSTAQQCQSRTPPPDMCRTCAERAQRSAPALRFVTSAPLSALRLPVRQHTVLSPPVELPLDVYHELSLRHRAASSAHETILGDLQSHSRLSPNVCMIDLFEAVPGLAALVRSPANCLDAFYRVAGPTEPFEGTLRLASGKLLVRKFAALYHASVSAAQGTLVTWLDFDVEVLSPAGAMGHFAHFALQRDISYLPFSSRDRWPAAAATYGRLQPLKTLASLVRFAAGWSVDTGVLSIRVGERTRALLLAMLKHWDGGLHALASYCVRAADDAATCVPSVPCGERWLRQNLYGDDLYVATLHVLASLHGWSNPFIDTPIPELSHGWLGQGVPTVGGGCALPEGTPSWWTTVCPNTSSLVSPFDLASIFLHHIGSTGPYSARANKALAPQDLRLPEIATAAAKGRLDTRLGLTPLPSGSKPPCEFEWWRRERNAILSNVSQ